MFSLDIEVVRTWCVPSAAVYILPCPAAHGCRRRRLTPRVGRGEPNVLEAHSMTGNPQHPLLGVIQGGSMSADDAAWATVADAAEQALTLPGLTEETTTELERVWRASCRCAGRLPSRSLQPVNPVSGLSLARSADDQRRREARRDHA